MTAQERTSGEPDGNEIDPHTNEIGRVIDAAEALARGHDEQTAANERQDRELETANARIAFLEAELQNRTSSEQELRGRLAAVESQLSQPPQSVETERREESKSDTERDLERLANITGRTPDDPGVIKLNLALKYDQFKQFTEAYDAQKTGRQVGFMQDMATAKRELEEAMYLYDPRFKEMDDKTARLKSQLERTRDPESRQQILRQIRGLKDHGVGRIQAGYETPRRDRADKLAAELDDVVRKVGLSEIFATYNLHQSEHPTEPIASRRRTDTRDWRGAPEYDENGVYVGSSPERSGAWTLEPKPPLDAVSSVEENRPENAPVAEIDPADVVDDSTEGQLTDTPDVPENQEEREPSDGPEDMSSRDNTSEHDAHNSEEDTPDESEPIEHTDDEPVPIEPIPLDDKKGKEVELYTRRLMEIPSINPGDYPELYARRKNLVGGDIEALTNEARRVAGEMSLNLEAQVNNFAFEHPGASEEEIRQFALQRYVEAQNDLQQDVIAAIDGVGYVAENGEVKGRSPLRRFGAWLEKHSKVIKGTMLAVGVAGAVVLTGGVLTGAIVPALAIGAGTAIGAAKGATIGLGMSRHGSKESTSRTIDLTSEDFSEQFEQLDINDRSSFANISTYLMQNYNAAADADHNRNVKKSRNAAIIGAAIGAVAGSVSFTSPETITVNETVRVPSDPYLETVPNNPEFNNMHYDVNRGDGEIKVIQGILEKLGIKVDVTEAQRIGEAAANGKHLNILTNDSNYADPYTSTLERIHSPGTYDVNAEALEKLVEAAKGRGHAFDWGTHTVLRSDPAFEVQHTRDVTQFVANKLAEVIKWVTAGTLTGAAARHAADVTR